MTYDCSSWINRNDRILHITVSSSVVLHPLHAPFLWQERLEYACRRASGNRVGRHITGDGGVCADRASVPDRDARHDRHVAAQPAVTSDCDRQSSFETLLPLGDRDVVRAAVEMYADTVVREATSDGLCRRPGAHTAD